MALFHILISLFLLANKLVQSQPPDVTSFQIDSFDQSSRSLTYQRDAFVPSGSNYVSLTAVDPASGRPRTRSVGRVLYSNPVQLWDNGRQSSFRTAIRLVVAPIDNNPADGMTFFMVPVNSTRPTGGDGGNLGIFNAVTAGSRIFAVEFDAYVNSPEDPNFRHIGIDINSRVSRNTTNFQSAMGQIVTAIINYNAPNRRITVIATYGLQTSRVEVVYNLRTLLPQRVHVGISASTGPGLVANFNVFSWYFTSTLLPDPNSNDDTAFIKQYVA